MRSMTRNFRACGSARSPRLLIAAIVPCIVTAGAAFGATLDVPSDFPSLNDALDVARPGDIVHLEAGSYQESVYITGLTGITFRGDGADVTVVEPDGGVIFDVYDSDNITIEGMSLNGAFLGVSVLESHDVTLQDLALRGDYGINSGGCYNLYVRRNLFEGGELGYYSYRDWARDPDGTTEFVVEDNRFVNTWIGVFIDSSLAMTVRRNTFTDALNLGVAINSWDPHAIYENLFEGGAGGLLVLEYDDEVWPPDITGGLPQEGTLARRSSRTRGSNEKTDGATDVTIFNNIFFRNAVVGIYGYGGAYNEERFWVSNNIFYQGFGTAIYGTPGGESDGTSWSDRMPVVYNTFFANGADFGGAISSRGKRGRARNLFSDPLFTDPDNGDFTLSSGSRSIDTGTLDVDGDGVKDVTDYTGRSRDRGIAER